MSESMKWPKNWQDSAKAAALAVPAERTATPARNVADDSFRWNAYDVWLSHARPLRGLTPKCSPSEQATPTQPGSALRN